jgi:adenosylcobinamide kinase/adenosylcobinamide-phosphate guanylyltransferase
VSEAGVSEAGVSEAGMSEAGVSQAGAAEQGASSAAAVAGARRVVLVGGGARSGKTGFALARARALGRRRVFVATAEGRDREMAERIAAHRAERGSAFRTVEEPRRLGRALAAIDGADVVVVDCLTLWLTNLLLADEPFAAIVQRIDDLAEVLAARRFHAVVVTSEVGLGLVPETALGRVFRDLAGLAHQRLARVADEVYLAALGCVVRLRPAPLESFTTEDFHDDPR